MFGDYSPDTRDAEKSDFSVAQEENSTALHHETVQKSE